MLKYTPTAALPLWARVTIERLDCDPALRSAAQLHYLLDTYARMYGETVDVQMRNRVVLMCRERGWV